MHLFISLLLIESDFPSLDRSSFYLHSPTRGSRKGFVNFLRGISEHGEAEERPEQTVMVRRSESVRREQGSQGRDQGA